MTGEAAPIEREIKLSAPPGLVLPDLSDLAPGGLHDSGMEPYETVYWDTAELDAARRSFGLRHRRRRDRPGTAGIWTLKLPGHVAADRVVRGEHEVVGDAVTPPRDLLDLLPGEVDPAALRPVAVLHADRRVLSLGSPREGGVEVMDDRVEILGPDGSVADSFRELEIEVGEGGDPLADRVAARLRAAGAGAPESLSKYGRALRVLGHALPPGAEV